MTAPSPGTLAEQVHRVDVSDTAVEVGSGDVPVLATPRLIGWFEAATVAALAGALADTDTSVGTRVEVDHVAPSPVGVNVAVQAEVATVDGPAVRFEVVARHPDGTVVARGRITRVIVDRARFVGRLAGHGA